MHQPRTGDPVEKTLLISFAGALLSLMILGALAYLASVQYAETLLRTARLQELKAELAEIRTALSRTESSQQAYFITGDTAYLAVNGNVRNRLASFRRTLAADQMSELTPVVPTLSDELEKRIDRRTTLLSQSRALHEAQPRDRREMSAIIAEGTREMAEIEVLAGRVEQQLDTVRENTAANTRLQGRRMIMGFLGLAVATIFFLAFMFWQIRLEVARRQQVQQLLSDREENLAGVLAAAVDGIIVINSSGTVQSMNPAAERTFGYRADEVIGRNVSMLMPEPYRSEHDGYLSHYLETGERKIIGIGREVSGQRKDGSVFPMELAVGETVTAGERRFIGTVRDITLRRKAEQEQRKLMADLCAANEELRNFSYVVSHDLKAPLRGIGSLAAWLMEDYGGALGDEGNRQMALLIGRVRRMDRLIDGILEYSRAGRLSEPLSMTDSGKALAAALDMSDVPANMAVKIETPLPSVAANATRLQQVFQNLIGNAVKHANRPGGEIRIGCVDEGSNWHFHVCDNGPGIEPRNFKRIFQLFQTLVPRDTAESTGVGLAIVRKIIELYGGRIWVESARGEGACFHFLLPKQPYSETRNLEENHVEG